jgi:hypothetical protein
VTRVDLLVLHITEVKTVLAEAAWCGGTVRDGGRQARPGRVARLAGLGVG